MNNSPTSNGPDPYYYDTSSVGELLKRKRKGRVIKACFPCRHRKVKCDGNSPCTSCVTRNHPDLCRVAPSQKFMPNGSHMISPGPQSQAATSAVHSPTDSVSRAYMNGGSVPGSTNADTSITGILSGRSPLAGSESIDATISRLEKIELEISSLKKDLIQRRRAERTSTLGGEVSTPQSHYAVATTDPSLCDPTPSNRGATPGTTPGARFVEETTGATIFLGSQSDPPLALGCRRAEGDAIEGAFLDQLIPRTYPFSDLWRPVVRAEEICQALPGDSDIIRYWQTYQNYVYPFYPALVTLDQFSVALFEFLDQRPSMDRGDLSYDSVDSAWMALLFAVLALGVQFSEDLIKERDLRSKVFICSSFQFLRFSNIFDNADMNKIQAMALIGHFLRNNQDTNSAWVLMGSTVRLAQSIGLHEEAISPESATNSTPERSLRCRLWWMLTWQDTFLSFTYDRPPISTNPGFTVPEIPESSRPAAGLTFAECVITLCQLIGERADRLRATTQGSDKDLSQMMVHYKRRFEEVLDSAAPFLTQKAFCRSLKDHLERLTLRIHANYGICRFFRFYIQNVSGETQDAQEMRRSVFNDCAWRAAEVIESFLDIYRLSASVCRSWALVHNAVSCAITLNLVGGMIGSARVEDLVHRLMAVLEREEKLSEWHDADTNRRHFGPYSRALRALKETFFVGEQATRQFEWWEFQ